MGLHFLFAGVLLCLLYHSPPSWASTVYTLGSGPDDFIPLKSFDSVKSAGLCAAMARRDKWLFFKHDGVTCHVGHASSGSSSVYAASVGSSPQALLTSGEDENMAIYLSESKICRAEQHGIPPLPSPQTAARRKGLLESKGILYACGGDGVRACNKLDLRQDTLSWQPLADMPAPMQVGRASLLATEDGGALFAVSVFSHATAYVYNVTGDSWGQTGAFVERSESRSAILYDGILYVMGGKLSDDQRPTVVEVLNTGDPGQDFQEHAYPLLTGYSTMACVGGVGLDGGAEVGILCAGGLGSTGQVSDAVQFLPLWPAPAPCRLLGKLPIQTRSSQMLLTGGRLFMIGGRHHPVGSFFGYDIKIHEFDFSTELFVLDPHNTVDVNKKLESTGLAEFPTYFRGCFFN